jgi:hypothetical protein
LKNFILRELSFLAAPSLLLSWKFFWSRMFVLGIVIAFTLLAGTVFAKILLLVALRSFDWMDGLLLLVLVPMATLCLYAIFNSSKGD